ncbi:ABC transporter permease [Acidovorax lacteus]|uniref:ABC transporter permease n=1 Tax=Acidovorax lacteus TaxID=1924988 RepID=A0ABP8KXW1_9BURK
MKALDRKLLRDLRRLWSQALTIALVVASGLGGFLTSLSAVESLDAARSRFYAEGRFADAFGQVRRAPRSELDVLRALPGVAEVEASIEQVVRIDVPGSDDAVIGQLTGLNLRAPQRLNRVSVRHGRMPVSATQTGGGSGALEVLVADGFADARGLRPGDAVEALVNGKRRTLRIVGTALSPATIFGGMAGVPDVRGFGVFWLDEDALAAAYDLQGAFNRLAVRYAPGADEAATRAALTQRLARYGGRDVHGRDEQGSHRMLDDEIRQQRIMGTLLPSIFLAVAAFLLHVVLTRLIATQREQIAALKALGYGNAALATHYLKLVGVIVAVGLLLGVALGKVLGALLTGLYAEFFRFPQLDHLLPLTLVAAGSAVTLGTALAGTLAAVSQAVRLAPAQAMRPPAPGVYRRTLAERLGVRGLPASLRMVLRNMERRALRTALTIGGTAAAVAIVVMGNFFSDAMDFMVDASFALAMRADVNVWVAEPVQASAAREIARLPGVMAVEPARTAAVHLAHGHRRERINLQGLEPAAALQRVIDVQGRQARVPEGGLLLTDRLAAKLGVQVGDWVEVQPLEGHRETVRVRVEGTAREMMGLNAYAHRDLLNRWLRDDDLATQFAVALLPGSEPQFLRALKLRPAVAGAFSKATLVRNMEEVSARNIRIMSTVLTLFAAVIAVGVVYNNARIALAERTWELASLRVLGFTRAEVSALLLGELAIGIALALPLGMCLGWGLVHLMVELMQNDQFLFPVVIRPPTYAWAGLCVVASGLASALVVRREVDRLDMVGALKTRE